MLGLGTLGTLQGHCEDTKGTAQGHLGEGDIGGDMWLGWQVLP